MASAHQVLCINKSDRQNHYERITHIGKKNADGTKWHITEAAAIADIEKREWTFYVGTGIHRVNVIISISRHGNKYLKTAGDGEQPNNLLSLPECV